MVMRGSTALESANALFRGAQAPANAERLSANIWDGVTATRSTRRWLHRGRAFAMAPSSFALDIPHVAFSTGEGEFPNEKLKALYLFPARAQIGGTTVGGSVAEKKEHIASCGKCA